MGLLIDDLLDLARLEGGGAELVMESLDLAALVRNSVERQRPRFKAENLSIEFHGMGDELLVEADGRRLEQVVDNQLANALRHVPAGGTVDVQVEVAGQSAALEVRDDGPGFSDEALPHVFERFYRGEASRTIPGSGLGLAIVREIVVRHGGTIEAANRAAGGAKLTVQLPLERSSVI
jgi:two-component system sensor histidine kinase BaeS